MYLNLASICFLYFKVHIHNQNCLAVMSSNLSPSSFKDYASWRVMISEIISPETYEFIWKFGRTPWMGGRLHARPPLTQDSAKQIDAGTYLCLEWDSNPRSQCLSGRRQ